MKIYSSCKIAFFGMMAAVFLLAVPANAQATRTWVSGVGDDANPCSRTAPCKTFAGAFAKTFIGGEIDALDPAGFGAVTINHSITIDGGGGTIAGVLVSGTNGITVDDSNLGNSVVVLRNLQFEGTGNAGQTSSAGINFVSGLELHIQNCDIRNFRASGSGGAGINFIPTTNSRLYVNDTIVSGSGSGSAGGGIVMAPTGTASVRATLDRVTLNANSNAGILINSTASGTIGVRTVMTNSTISGNSNGVQIIASGGAPATGILANSNISNNNDAGVKVSGANAAAILRQDTISGNSTGAIATGGGSLNSYSDNTIVGNFSTDVSPTPSPVPTR